MMNWKTTGQLLITAVVSVLLTALVWLWRDADDIESFTNKGEWSLLQGLSYNNRSTPLKGMEFLTLSGNTVVCLPGLDGQRVWIMLDAVGSTRYKQMPDDRNFTITEQQLDEIRKRGKPISTVEQVLTSHLEPSRMEPNKRLQERRNAVHEP